MLDIDRSEPMSQAEKIYNDVADILVPLIRTRWTTERYEKLQDEIMDAYRYWAKDYVLDCKVTPAAPPKTWSRKRRLKWHRRLRRRGLVTIKAWVVVPTPLETISIKLVV